MTTLTLLHKQSLTRFTLQKIDDHYILTSDDYEDTAIDSVSINPNDPNTISLKKTNPNGSPEYTEFLITEHNANDQ
jgi:hypothetical protein